LHCASLETSDLDVLANARVSVVLTPRSVILKETEAPRIAELMSRRVPIVLASDWGVSDPFEVMRSYTILARSQNVDVPTGTKLVRMMTIEAARALGVDDQAGSLEVGKKADIAFFDISGARFAGVLGRDITAFLSPVLQESTSRDVSDVLINGEFFVRQGQVLMYSKEDLVQEGEQLMEKLSQFIASAIEPAEEKHSDLKSIVDQQNAERVDSQDFEDGFRIIPREASPVNIERKIIPLQSESTKKVELPKKVKKIFGEEDT